MTDSYFTPSRASVCECGCGLPTKQFRGKFYRFLAHHHNRLTGKLALHWCGGIERGAGRIWVLSPEHPRANEHGKVLRSHLVMESHLGRTILPNEVVHHINLDKQDDRIENLRLMTRTAHSVLHARNHDLCLAKPKLTECQVTEIRRLRDAGLVMRDTVRSRGIQAPFTNLRLLAALFGVDRATIRKILDNRTWRSTPNGQPGH